MTTVMSEIDLGHAWSVYHAFYNHDMIRIKQGAAERMGYRSSLKNGTTRAIEVEAINSSMRAKICYFVLGRRKP